LVEALQRGDQPEVPTETLVFTPHELNEEAAGAA
jgi:hypothetical protein